MTAENGNRNTVSGIDAVTETIPEVKTNRFGKMPKSVIRMIPHRQFRRRTRPGAPPGTLVADPRAVAPAMTLIQYSSDRCECRRINDLNEFDAPGASGQVCWLNIDGLGDVDLLRQIQSRFALHALTTEDIVNTHQRAKVDPYGDCLYVVAHMFAGKHDQLTEQVSFFLGPGYLLTFQERRGDCFDPVRERLQKGIGQIRRRGADYLLYALLDTVIDGYFPILDRHGDSMDQLEEQVALHPAPSALAGIHTLRTELRQLRRVLWPHREAVAQLYRDPHPLIGAETTVHLRDCHDHVIQLLDVLEFDREQAAGLQELYLSIAGHRTNEIMRILTILTTLFMPVTAIAGIYGMNFAHMPELNWRFGYPMSLLLMAGCSAGLLTLLWFVGWLSPKHSGLPSQHKD